MDVHTLSIGSSFQRPIESFTLSIAHGMVRSRHGLSYTQHGTYFLDDLACEVWTMVTM